MTRTPRRCIFNEQLALDREVHNTERRVEMKLLGIALVITVVVSAESRLLSRCELTRELIKQQIPRSLLSNWVCLVENVSGGNTATSVGPQKDGSYDLGIFKINSKKWCKKGYVGGDCNIRCEVLTDNTVADDIACAKKIYNIKGFAGWSKWVEKCKNKKPLPNVSDCYRP